MGQASPKLVSWAAKEGRVEDLIYHLNQTGPDGLKPAAGTEKRRSPLHLAAIGGYVQCISVLYDAGMQTVTMCSLLGLATQSHSHTSIPRVWE